MRCVSVYLLPDLYLLHTAMWRRMPELPPIKQSTPPLGGSERTHDHEPTLVPRPVSDHPGRCRRPHPRNWANDQGIEKVANVFALKCAAPVFNFLHIRTLPENAAVNSTRSPPPAVAPLSNTCRYNLLFVEGGHTNPTGKVTVNVKSPLSSCR